LCDNPDNKATWPKTPRVEFVTYAESLQEKTEFDTALTQLLCDHAEPGKQVRDEYEDRWDGDYVRMPFSPQSLYPAGDGVKVRVVIPKNKHLTDC